MSKLDEVLKILESPGGTSRSNSAIAIEVGCDEGMVRRARKDNLIDSMISRIATLETELARYRRATLPPKRDRHGQDRHFPLFEEYLKHFIVD